MPGQLIGCIPGKIYLTTFWTLERDPSVTDLTRHAKRVAVLYRDLFPGAKILVAPEVSATAYHHDHVLMRTSRPQRFSLRTLEKLRKELQWPKPDKSHMSIRAFHTRRGDPDEYNSLSKYLTESKYKVKPISKDIIELDDVTPRLVDFINKRGRPPPHNDPFTWLNQTAMQYDTNDEFFAAAAVSASKKPCCPNCTAFSDLYTDYLGGQKREFLAPPENKNS